MLVATLDACLRIPVVAGACLALRSMPAAQAWYAGLQEGQRQECYQEPSPSAVQSCLDRVNDMDYEDYERARSGSTGASR